MKCGHNSGGEVKDHASDKGTSTNIYCKDCGAFMICLDEGYEGPMFLPEMIQ